MASWRAPRSWRTRIADLFDDLRIPVFPPPDRLAAFADYIDHDAYRALAGVERFALMNIGARLQSIAARARRRRRHAGRPAFRDPRLRRVPRPRVLHREGRSSCAPSRRWPHAGSSRGRPRGCIASTTAATSSGRGARATSRSATRPALPQILRDATRLCVDADIDLYRGTVSHLFGEVLVNHLTGIEDRSVQGMGHAGGRQRAADRRLRRDRGVAEAGSRESGRLNCASAS